MAQFSNLRRADADAPVNVVVDVTPVAEASAVAQPEVTKAAEALPDGRVTLVLSYEEFAALGRRCVETRQSKQRFIKGLVLEALGMGQ